MAEFNKNIDAILLAPPFYKGLPLLNISFWYTGINNHIGIVAYFLPLRCLAEISLYCAKLITTATKSPSALQSFAISIDIALRPELEATITISSLSMQ